MRNFKAGNISQWTKYKSEKIKFEDVSHTHTIHIKVIGSGEFAVYANDSSHPKTLVACGNNETINLSLTIDEKTVITMEGANVFYNLPVNAQTPIERVYPDENFVSLEPRKTISPEIYAMELRMRENMAKMHRLIDNERMARKTAEAARDAAASQVIEPEAPAETPAE